MSVLEGVHRSGLTLRNLYEKRESMQKQIHAIQQAFNQRELNPTEYYNRYERLGLQLFQINSDIHDLDPSENHYLQQTIQL